MIEQFSHYRIRLENLTGNTITVNSISITGAKFVGSDLTFATPVDAKGAGLITIANTVVGDGTDQDNTVLQQVVGSVYINITGGATVTGTNPVVNVFLMSAPDSTTIPLDKKGQLIGVIAGVVAATVRDGNFGI